METYNWTQNIYNTNRQLHTHTRIMRNFIRLNCVRVNVNMVIMVWFYVITVIRITVNPCIYDTLYIWYSPECNLDTWIFSHAFSFFLSQHGLVDLAL